MSDIDLSAPVRTEFLAIAAAFLAFDQALAADRAGDIEGHRLVGHAIGILMERYEITDDRALHCLQRMAVAGQVGLSEVARVVVDRVKQRAEAAVRREAPAA